MSDEKSLIAKELENIDFWEIKKGLEPSEEGTGCGNCMNYRPSYGSRFTCPECGTVYVLANVFPGNYWEPEVESIKTRIRAQHLINSINKGANHAKR